MAFLMMSPRFNPVVNGKPIDEKNLRTVKFFDDDGNERTATCLLLAARHIVDDDWRMYVYGAGKKPLIDAKFADAEEKRTGVLAIHVGAVQGDVATLVVTIFGKYAASFQIGHKLD